MRDLYALWDVCGGGDNGVFAYELKLMQISIKAIPAKKSLLINPNIMSWYDAGNFKMFGAGIGDAIYNFSIFAPRKEIIF